MAKCKNCESSAFPHLGVETDISDTEKINLLKRELAKLETDFREQKAAGDTASLKLTNRKISDTKSLLSTLESSIVSSIEPEEEEIDYMLASHRLDEKKRERDEIQKEISRLKVDRDILIKMKDSGEYVTDDHFISNDAAMLNAKKRLDAATDAINALKMEVGE